MIENTLVCIILQLRSRAISSKVGKKNEEREKKKKKVITKLWNIYYPDKKITRIQTSHQPQYKLHVIRSTWFVFPRVVRFFLFLLSSGFCDHPRKNVYLSISISAYILISRVSKQPRILLLECYRVDALTQIEKLADLKNDYTYRKEKKQHTSDSLKIQHSK